MKKQNNGKTTRSVSEAIERNAFEGNALTKEEIRKALIQDLEMIRVFVLDILCKNETLDTLTDMYYGRYKKLMEEKQVAPELPLTPQV